jgi:hypothetical protein
MGLEAHEYHFGQRIIVDVKKFTDRKRTTAVTKCNGNYKQIEALAIICNELGKQGLTYGVDFIWDDFWEDEVTIYFKNEQPAFISKLRWS